MQDFRKSIADVVQQNRPSISASSLKTYVSIVSKLYASMYDTSSFDPKRLENIDDVMKQIEKKALPTQKTAMSALLSVLKPKSAAYNRVHSNMMSLSREYKHIKGENLMDAKQKANWVTQDQIKELYNRMLEQCKPILKKKTKPTMNELQTVQNLVILACTSGTLGLAPRRILDWIMMTNKPNDNTETTNSILFKRGMPYRLVFRVFKTKHSLGQQDIDCPTELATLLKKWIAMSKDTSKWLFFNSQGEPLRGDQFTRRLNSIFGKNISVNVLRHSFVTNYYQKNGIRSLNDMQELAESMGQGDVQTNLGYILEDAPKKQRVE